MRRRSLIRATRAAIGIIVIQAIQQPARKSKRVVRAADTERRILPSLRHANLRLLFEHTVSGNLHIEVVLERLGNQPL
jgi:hypothetical protein